jgi:hypothetical protein
MSVDRIGGVTNMVIVAEAESVKKQKKCGSETSHVDVVSIGEGDSIKATQVKWAPLFPIGHTQGIFNIDE